MAAAVTALVVLPLLASEGQITTTDGTDTVNVAVFAVADVATANDDALAALKVTGTNSKDTKVGNTLYVSNRSTAFRRVFVTITDPGQGAATITADVENTTTGATALTLVLNEASPAADKFQGIFDVVETVDVNADPPQIVGTNDHVIEVQFGSIVVKLTVDDKKPKIELTSPADGTIQTSDSGEFTGTITDDGSGLRADITGEEGGPDADNDGVTADEPLPAGNGTSLDININIGFDTVDVVDNSATEFSGLASAGWSVVTDGFSFTLTKGSLVEGDTFWNITAIDRASNKRTTDADGSADDDDNFTLTVDKKDPKIVKAETGIGWDDGKEEEKNKSDFIKVTFTTEGLAISGLEVNPTNADFLDNSTVDVADFRIEASKTDTTVLSIKSVIHPNLKKKTGGPENLAEVEFETRHIVYIRLNDKMAPDAKPRVNLIGNLRDKAGRASPPHSVVAVDKIEPSLTVTITSEKGAASRPVAEGDSDDRINIRVVSDEDLNAAPTVYFVDFIFDNLDPDETKHRLEVNDVSAVVSLSSVSGLDNTWDTDQESSAPGKPDNSLIGVHVVAVDKNGNTGVTSGISVDPADDTAPTGAKDPPEFGNKVDLSKMEDQLFEFDKALADPGFTLTPSIAGKSTETESTNPFLRIDFSEGKEYNVPNATDTKDKTQDKLEFGTPPVEVEVDSHNAVTLTKLELEDEAGNTTDLLGTEGTIDKDSFVLSLQGLAVGTYELVVNGEDAVGNDLSSDEKFNFEVKKRSKYEVSLDPGWNLISLPGTPADPSLDAVLPDSMNASRVLQWVNGAFIVAERGSDGLWDPSSQITEIVAGPGYWVFTGAFEDIEALIPERDPAIVLPTVDIVGGWNLVGIVDVSQAPAGKAPGDDGEDPDEVVKPDVYFASLDWSVAYSFDTTLRAWTKHTDKTTASVLNGKGYWVWANKAGTLVP